MNSERPYYIIEHPTRGVLMELEWSPNETQYGRFSVERLRSEAHRFPTQQMAERAREQIHPPKLRMHCQIRSSAVPDSFNGAWAVVA